MKKIYIVLSLILILAFKYHYEHEDKMLDKAFIYAKENRNELEKVLEYYKNDEEKLAAAKFLIRNMPYNYTLEQYYISPKKEILKLNTMKYTPDSLKKIHDSLILNGYKIKNHIKYDINYIGIIHFRLVCLYIIKIRKDVGSREKCPTFCYKFAE